MCSIWEAVLLSITPSYIASQPEESALAKTLKEWKRDIDRPLAAILTLNTIAHTVGAIMVGVQASKVLPASFQVGPISGEGIVAAAMTIAILILSEIIPKTLGANYWRSILPFTVVSLRLLLTILAPFVWLSQIITRNFKRDKDMSVLSRADFSALTTVGAQSGALGNEESRAIRNLLRLDQIPVKSIMTPRAVMKTVRITDTLEQVYVSLQPFRFSRIPVFDAEKEHIEGILLKDDLLQAMYEGHESKQVSSYMRSPLFIQSSERLSELQKLLMKNKNHMAMVIDEFGALLGLVTMEDLFETILGLEILDETDDVEDLQKHARELWKQRAKKLGISNTKL